MYDEITLLNDSDSPIFAYKTDRNYTNLLYSSNTLTNEIYTLYQGGTIEGTSNNGFYLKELS